MHRFVGIVVLLLVIGGACSDDGDQTAAPTTGVTTSGTPTSAADLADCSHRPSGSSQALFDPSGGTYAAQAVAVEGPDRVRFDIVQWLSGEDANEAYFRETGDDSGAPNDYFIVNESNEVRVARVAEDADIYVLRADGYADSLHAVSLKDVPTNKPERTFWLTFTDGSITEICQQYRP